jgi:hypothetical protein
MKHITPSFKAKKDKIYAEVDIRKYDSQKSQDLIEMKGVILKNIEVGIEYFKIKKSRITEREVANICEVLKSARGRIP